ncbi:MAG: alpha-ketoglutarate-dependent dioxygenase AlkB [Proteobacteria bacterium]|nr:alpha-ketoglutarate-dependent dioxygenase AlkB [Pseudomonadota bacterium]
MITGDLFAQINDSSRNLLPQDGEVYYHGVVFNVREADRYFDRLLNEIDWQSDQARIGGKIIKTARKVAWYGEQAFRYRYSGVQKIAQPWTDTLQAIKQVIEHHSQTTYNSCLLNLYHSGQEGMAWHSDGEKDLKQGAAIASVSLGAERRFMFKHKQSKEKVAIPLAHGSLLIMQGETQKHWQHRLPPTVKVTEPRINLTFRTIEQ